MRTLAEYLNDTGIPDSPTEETVAVPKELIRHIKETLQSSTYVYDFFLAEKLEKVAELSKR